MGEHLFEKLARDRGITVEEMREIISARIRRGMNDPDPKKRAQWEAIPHEGGDSHAGGVAVLYGELSNRAWGWRSAAVVSKSVNGRPWRVFTLGDMG